VTAGEVVEWKDAGYGFIRPDGGGRDIFFHAQDLPRSSTRPRIGQRVQFEVTEGKKGPQAVSVSLIAGATVEPSSDEPPPLAPGECDVFTAAAFEAKLRAIIAPAVEAVVSEALDLGRQSGWIEG
jgi:cold shock protein